MMVSLSSSVVYRRKNKATVYRLGLFCLSQICCSLGGAENASLWSPHGCKQKAQQPLVVKAVRLLETVSKDHHPSLASTPPLNLPETLNRAGSYGFSRFSRSHKLQFHGVSLNSTGCSPNPNSNLKSNPNRDN